MITTPKNIMIKLKNMVLQNQLVFKLKEKESLMCQTLKTKKIGIKFR